MQPRETIPVSTSTFFCDGTNASSPGHPRVFLTITAKGHVDCPYCGRRFVLEGEKAKAH